MAPFPVEFKSTTQRLNLNAKYQLTAYALMVEECLGQSVSQGFIYRIPTQRITAVPISETLRRRTLDAIKQIRSMLSTEWMPPPTPQRGKCVECEFRRFCADVL